MTEPTAAAAGQAATGLTPAGWAPYPLAADPAPAAARAQAATPALAYSGAVTATAGQASASAPAPVVATAGTPPPLPVTPAVPSTAAPGLTPTGWWPYSVPGGSRRAAAAGRGCGAVGAPGPGAPVPGRTCSPRVRRGVGVRAGPGHPDHRRSQPRTRRSASALAPDPAVRAGASGFAGTALRRRAARRTRRPRPPPQPPPGPAPASASAPDPSVRVTAGPAPGPGSRDRTGPRGPPAGQRGSLPGRTATGSAPGHDPRRHRHGDRGRRSSVRPGPGDHHGRQDRSGPFSRARQRTAAGRPGHRHGGPARSRRHSTGPGPDPDGPRRPPGSRHAAGRAFDPGNTIATTATPAAAEAAGSVPLVGTTGKIPVWQAQAASVAPDPGRAVATGAEAARATAPHRTRQSSRTSKARPPPRPRARKHPSRWPRQRGRHQPAAATASAPNPASAPSTDIPAPAPAAAGSTPTPSAAVTAPAGRHLGRQGPDPALAPSASAPARPATAGAMHRTRRRRSRPGPRRRPSGRDQTPLLHRLPARQPSRASRPVQPGVSAAATASPAPQRAGQRPDPPLLPRRTPSSATARAAAPARRCPARSWPPPVSRPRPGGHRPDPDDRDDGEPGRGGGGRVGAAGRDHREDPRLARDRWHVSPGPGRAVTTGTPTP